MNGLPPPSDLIELEFMRMAMLELGLLSIAGGLLGAFVVLRRLAFYAHAVGTATFPGLVIAEASGFSGAAAGLVMALGYAGGVERAGRAGRDPGDAATALLLVAALAGGIVLASDVFESGAAVDRLLFGTALGLGDGDLVIAAVSAAGAVLATVLLGPGWTAVGFDPAGAASLRLPVAAADLLLLGAVAIAVVAALPAVGALLVSALFVVPAATARLFARTVPALLASAVAIAACEALAGLYVALWLDVPPGPAVAVIGAAVWIVVAVLTSARIPAAEAA